MSQRLHIGDSEDKIYDCIITGANGVREKLLEEWLCLSGGMFFGPLRIWVSDVDLFEKIQPAFTQVFETVGKPYPGYIWDINIKGNTIEHPTIDELNKFVQMVKANNFDDNRNIHFVMAEGKHANL